MRPVVLTLRALGIGDLLTAVPALRALAGAFPDHHRVLATQPKLADLAMLTGAVDAVVSVEALPAWRRRLPPPRVAVNLHSNSEATYRLLQATEPERLVGFHNPAVLETAGFPVLAAGEHEVVRWCRLLKENGIAAEPADLDLDIPPDAAAPATRGATLLHPGSSDAARRWPPDRWAVVARAEVKADRGIIITGSADEEPMGREIAEQARLEHGATWRGGTDVMGLATLVAAAGRVVSVDTGVAHLATALRTPSVVLFGPRQPPSRWGPPPDRPWHSVLVPAQGPGGQGGMETIAASDVLAALRCLR